MGNAWSWAALEMCSGPLSQCKHAVHLKPLALPVVGTLEHSRHHPGWLHAQMAAKAGGWQQRDLQLPVPDVPVGL